MTKIQVSERHNIDKLYKEGNDFKQISQIYNVHSSCIGRFFQRNKINSSIHNYDKDNIKKIQRRLSKQEGKDLCKLYEISGYSYNQLSEVFNIGEGAICSFLSRRGYTSIPQTIQKRKYSINENYFEKIDCEEKAYFLGFIYADGNNYPEANKVSIGLHNKDTEILEKFKKLLNSERPLQFIEAKEIKGINNSKKCILNITNKKISNDLQNLGVVKAKSLILKFPTEEQVPSHLIHHFIRGYFDGDGCIHSTYLKNTKKETHKFVYAWSVISTEKFVLEIQKILIAELNLNKIKLYKKGKVFYLKYNGRKQCIKIMEYLYKNASIYLERKFNKFIEIK